MNGSVEHMSLSEARKNTSSSQSRLSSFGTSETTYIGVVRSPNDDFESVVDETEPDLAPPESLFYQWLQIRNDLESEGMPSVQAHNEALDRTDYRDRFERYLHTEDAEDALESVLDRAEDGEHIVLVCYCGEAKWCHREMVFERLMEMADERVNA